jgi:hypothetical protein
VRDARLRRGALHAFASPTCPAFVIGNAGVGFGLPRMTRKRDGSGRITVEDARRIREEFDPKEMVIPDRVLGLADLVPAAVRFKFITQPLTEAQLNELVQIPR